MNGPALDAEGPRVAVAWFTKGPEGAPRVLLARSEDGGRTFARPVAVAERAALGRAAVALLPDGAALVGWLEEAGPVAELRIRRVSKDGEPGPPLAAAKLPATRASGFPRLARAGAGAVLAWTDPAAGPQVKMAMIRVRE